VEKAHMEQVTDAQEHSDGLKGFDRKSVAPTCQGFPRVSAVCRRKDEDGRHVVGGNAGLERLDEIEPESGSMCQSRSRRSGWRSANFFERLGGIGDADAMA